MTQTSLFEAPTLPPAPPREHHARGDDPDTAKQAAEAIRPVLGNECKLVLGAVRERGGSATAYEVVLVLRMAGIERQQNCVARRLRDLADAGLVADSGARRHGSSGRELIVWAMAS